MLTNLEINLKMCKGIFCFSKIFRDRKGKKIEDIYASTPKYFLSFLVFIPTAYIEWFLGEMS